MWALSQRYELVGLDSVEQIGPGDWRTLLGPGHGQGAGRAVAHGLRAALPGPARAPGTARYVAAVNTTQKER